MKIGINFPPPPAKLLSPTTAARVKAIRAVIKALPAIKAIPPIPMAIRVPVIEEYLYFVNKIQLLSILPFIIRPAAIKASIPPFLPNLSLRPVSTRERASSMIEVNSEYEILPAINSDVFISFASGSLTTLMPFNKRNSSRSVRRSNSLTNSSFKHIQLKELLHSSKVRFNLLPPSTFLTLPVFVIDLAVVVKTSLADGEDVDVIEIFVLSMEADSANLKYKRKTPK
ncbi:hypothetical protein FF38_12541 [Lucilia cuprina]|uniref:Uncharacterized protein n=1 Tax=Lucilia cuprina TaxID=7375 RepID=A0A0L0BMZ1_LUCCU|nr:hypothetical protein FF38_12541 [Lucilia cuprina]